MTWLCRPVSLHLVPRRSTPPPPALRGAGRPFILGSTPSSPPAWSQCRGRGVAHSRLREEERIGRVPALASRSPWTCRRLPGLCPGTGGGGGGEGLAVRPADLSQLGAVNLGTAQVAGAPRLRNVRPAVTLPGPPP